MPTYHKRVSSAAFRRLCVETVGQQLSPREDRPAAFRRLCVETFILDFTHFEKSQPPSGGCVLKPGSGKTLMAVSDSAAFRRLCVETANE